MMNHTFSSRKLFPLLAILALCLSSLACKAVAGDQGNGSLPFLTQPTPTPEVYTLQVYEPVVTEIEVKAGDYVWIKASGQITLGFFVGSSGPDGKDSAMLSGYNLIPEYPHGALLCRLKGSEGWFLCGAEQELRAQKDGVIELTINDNDRENNSGAFDVTVVVSQYSARDQQNIQSATEPEAPSGEDTARDYLSGELTCFGQGDSFTVDGALVNKSDRSIVLEMTLSIYEDGNLFDTVAETIALPPGEETYIYFTGGYIPDPYANAPMDDPDTPEYEPEAWAETYGVASYSCDINSVASWADRLGSVMGYLRCIKDVRATE